MVLSNGLWSESFQPGARLFKEGCAVTQREILTLFPDLKETAYAPFEAARIVLKAHEAALVLH